MKFRLACALLLTSLVACGGDDDNGKPVDAAVAVPQMINISGKTQSAGVQINPLGGVTVGVYKNGDDSTPLATATSDQSGAFTIDVPTGGAAVDGYIKANITGFFDSYFYPPAKLSADYDASINIVTRDTVNALSTLCAKVVDPDTQGFVGVGVYGADGNPIAGAVVSSTPAPTAGYCYDGTTAGFPDKNQTMTNADGLAYLVNINGDLEITASKSGVTFATTKVNARIAVLTTTQVIGQ
ncbi:MAG TPA: hypothetical protein VGC41_20675 [Kofleriaceae bacterium]